MLTRSLYVLTLFDEWVEYVTMHKIGLPSNEIFTSEVNKFDLYPRDDKHYDLDDAHRRWHLAIT